MRRPRSSNGGTMSTENPRRPPSAARKAGEPVRALAEMKVVADHDPGDVEQPDQDALDEFGRVEAGERGVEIHYDGTVEPGRRQQPELGRLVAEPKDGHVAVEEGARMRLESQRRRRTAELAGPRNRGVDHRAVAAMDPLEISDRQHAALAAQPGSGVVGSTPPRTTVNGGGEVGNIGHGGCGSNGGADRDVRMAAVKSSRRRRAARGGTETEASPSSTARPSTAASQARRTLRPFVDQFHHLDRHRHHVADLDRGVEIEGLRAIDRARSRQPGTENRPRSGSPCTGRGRSARRTRELAA